MRKKYAPKPRFVVELSKPRILTAYLNGEPIDPDSLKAGIEARGSRGDISVTVTQETIKEITGEEFPVGRFPEMEVVFV